MFCVMLRERTLLLLLTVFSVLAPSLPTEFHLCSYDENYKTTFEERKFYAMITKKTLMKCSKVIVKQVLEIPSDPKRIFEAAFPKLCFMYRVCMTVIIRANATGRSRYQLSIEDTERLVDCAVRFSKLIDQSLLVAMFNLTDIEAMQINPVDVLVEVLSCYLRHVGPAPGQIDPALKISYQIYAKICKLLD